MLIAELCENMSRMVLQIYEIYIDWSEALIMSLKRYYNSPQHAKCLKRWFLHISTPQKGEQNDRIFFLKMSFIEKQ